MHEGYIERKYKEFYVKHGYIPHMFNAHDCKEIKDYAPTLTIYCDHPTASGNVLILETKQ